MIRAVAALATLAAASQQLPRQQPRLRPAAALSGQTQGGTASVNVLDFGADPHSHNDSTAAFNEAFKAAQLIGPRAVHHALELRSALVTHSRAKLDAVGLASVRVHHGSMHAIDRAASMRFSQIRWS